MIENKKYFVALVNSSKACQFTAYYHYSKQPFRQAKLNLGVFNKETQQLVGVMQWGRSFAKDIKLKRYVKEDIDINQYFELNRFCMAEDEGKNSESQALSLGIKYIKQYHPEIKLLVSYSGRREGKYGYIYQATNWEYLGYFLSNAFWNIDGIEKHTLTVQQEFQKYKKTNEDLKNYLNRTHSYAVQTWTKQFIYIQRLDKHLSPAIDPLPYPKPSNEFPIKTKEIVYCGGTIPNTKVEEKEVPLFFFEKNELLFSPHALRRQAQRERGEKIHIGTRNSVAQYDLSGNLETTYLNMTEAEKVGYYYDGVKAASKNNTIYKNKFFRLYPMNRTPPEKVELHYFCIINEKMFFKAKDVAEELHISRQAVYASKKRQGKYISGSPVIWGDL